MEIPDKNDLESIYLCSMAVALSDTMDELDYPCCISYFFDKTFLLNGNRYDKIQISPFCNFAYYSILYMQHNLCD